jgi:hypothetical protein
MPVRDYQSSAPARARPQVASPGRHGGDFTPGAVSRVQTQPTHGGDFTPDLPAKSQTFPKHGGDFTPGSPDADEGSLATTISLSSQASHTSQNRAPPLSASTPPGPSGLSFPSSSSYASSSRTPSVSASSVTVVGSPRTPAGSFKTTAVGQGLHDIPLGPVGHPKPPPMPQDGSQYAQMHLSASRSVRSVAESSRVRIPARHHQQMLTSSKTAVSTAHSTAPFAMQAPPLPQAEAYNVIPADGSVCPLPCPPEQFSRY